MHCMDPRACRPSEIVSRLRTALSDDPQWLRLLEEAPGIHLAILVEPFLTYVLDGRKTIESRFSLNKTPPFERVSAGDVVLLKRSSGPVVGVVNVKRTEFITLDVKTWPRIRALSDDLCADETFWDARADKRYATLLHVGVVKALEPMWIEKSDRRPWVVLRDPHQTELQPTCAP